MEYLLKEKSHLNSVIEEEKKDKALKGEREYIQHKERLAAIHTMNNARIQSLEDFLNNQIKHKASLNQKLKTLQQLPLDDAGTSIQERVDKVEALLATNQDTIDLINENISLATQYQVVLDEESSRLEIWNQHFRLKQKLAEIKAQKKLLNSQLIVLYAKNATLSSDNKIAVTKPQSIHEEASQLVNNQYIALLQNSLNVLDMKKKIIKARMQLLDHDDTKTLQMVADTYKKIISQYANIEKSLHKISDFLITAVALTGKDTLNKSIVTLQSRIRSELKALENEREHYTKELDDFQNQIKKIVSARQSLSEYSIDSWPVIIHKISVMPHQFYKYLKGLLLKVIDSYSWFDLFTSAALWLGLGLILVAFALFNRLLKSLRPDNESERTLMTGYLYDGLVTLLQRNIPYICLFAMLWLVLYVTNISYANYQLLFYLIAVWFSFRILILIARLVLLERVSDSSGKDVKLYYRLKWLFLFGGWAIALMTFSQQLPMSLLMQDLFNRLVMLFILSVSLVAWKSKDVIPHLISPMLIDKKRYFKTAISLLVILIPVTLFTTAIMGLFGFINLAWIMSRYQAYVLIVLVSYILARGLVFDLLELLSEWMIASLHNGWLWIEVFLKPLDKILRIVLLFLCGVFLFQLFGWHSDSVVMTNLRLFVQYTIINVPGIQVTVASTIEFFVVLAMLIWASKWTREFCYRWLYSNAKDIGIRNSLAIFTQYAVILLGGFITLRILGLDFSGMSMILGGLAVGMGFGLRDFASNIVGGIMLLIERPVREGDLITIGDHEGQVSHIGIRSMRVSSWDNTEVLIPNAETFNKPFTNWTHQDGIVRTVIPVKVSRSDDPVMVQQLILDVLAIVPEIVADPPAQVFLKKIDAALIEFEVRYFINVQVHSRVEIRSKVLFAITAQFKAAGVKAPIEPITIELKEGQGDIFSTKQPPSD